MGISDFLTRVLESAGQVCDLKCYADGITEPVDHPHTHKRRRRRPMRIGIDVSSWVYNAAHGYGDMLADERHLSNYGRAALYDEQQQLQRRQKELDPSSSLNLSEETIREYVQTCTRYVLTRMEILRDTTKADILVVLDGSSPPIKTLEVERRRALRQEQERLREEPVDPNESPSKNNMRRTKAFRRAGAGRYYNQIIDELLQALRQARLAFLVAPYEADSELAYLSDMGFIDLVVTEDSDLVAHGAKVILYKTVTEVTNSNPRGRLLKFSDIGSVEGDKFYLDDFTPVMMTVLFVSVGCDYCDKLKGVGLLTASRVIREAFCTPFQPPSFRKRPLKEPSKLTRVFEELYLRCYMSSSAMTPEFKRSYEERFLSAIFMYRHPIVYDPLQENNVLSSRCLIEDTMRTRDTEIREASPTMLAGRQNSIDPVRLFVDEELLDHEPYVELCCDFERIQNIVGRLRPKEEAARLAQGLNRRSKNANDGDNEKDKVITSEGSQEQAAVPAADESPVLATQEEATFSHHHDKENSEGVRSSQKSNKEAQSTIQDPAASGSSQVKEEPEHEDSSDEEGLETQPLVPAEQRTVRRLEVDFLAVTRGEDAHKTVENSFTTFPSPSSTTKDNDKRRDKPTSSFSPVDPQTQPGELKLSEDNFTFEV